MNANNLNTGGQRLAAIFFRHEHKSVREQADIMLFGAGLSVEYVLLFALFGHYASSAPSGIMIFFAFLVLASLFFALAVHQFLIFRNYSLHYSLSGNRLRPLERFICLLFGVLSGELGYLLVLSICSNPLWLTDLSNVFKSLFAIASLVALILTIRYAISKHRQSLLKQKTTWFIFGLLFGLVLIFVFAFNTDSNLFVIKPWPNGLQWFFAEKPLTFAKPTTVDEIDYAVIATKTIYWFAHSLGCALKAVFALGAAILSFMILIWDFFAGRDFGQSGLSANNHAWLNEEKGAAVPPTAEKNNDKSDNKVIAESNKTAKKFFYTMDILASATWLFVLGAVLPKGLFGTSPQEWCIILGFGGFLYAASAIVRLWFAKNILGSLSSWDRAKVTVI